MLTEARLRQIIREELQESEERLLREMKDLIRNEVERAICPPLMSAAEMAHRYGISELHVHRVCEKLGIPKRDEHGHIKKGNAGLTRYSICEWEDARKISTRTITNQVRRGEI